MTRGAARFVGSGALFYLAVSVPDIVGQAELSEPWWTVLAVAAVALSGAGLFVSGWGDLAAIRHAAAVFAATYVVCAALFLVAATDGTIEATRGTWLSLFPGLPAVALAVVVRPAYAVAYLLVASLLAQSTTWSVRPSAPGMIGLLDFSWGVSFSALFAAAAYATVRSGRLLDRTADAAREMAGIAASVEARDAERRRFDALIHDGVMATLLSAGRSANNALITQQSVETTRQLDRLRSGSQERTELTAAELVAHLRASASSVDDEIGLQTSGAPPPDVRIPAEAARALGAGVVEATRNVRRHADTATRRASCEVLVVFAPDSVRVDIVDDGVGFDPRTVPAHRLGLQVSIRSRFESLAGGWSRVESEVGRGTRVSIGCAAA